MILWSLALVVLDFETFSYPVVGISARSSKGISNSQQLFRKTMKSFGEYQYVQWIVFGIPYLANSISSHTPLYLF